MTLEEAQAQMAAATKSAQEQLELNKQSLTNQLDAGDRLMLRKAADVSLNLAELAATDPS